MSSFFDASIENATDAGNIINMCEDFGEELRDIINEMGYDVEEEELREIEKDLKVLEENADVADQKLFSCLLGHFDEFPTSATDPDLSLQNLTNLMVSTPQKHKANIPREFDELITHGYERLQEVYLDIKKYERLLEESEHKRERRGTAGPGPSSQPVDEPESDRPFEQEEDRPTREKENMGNIDAEQKQMSRKEETRQINQYLRANALRATRCPEPGRLPFKHDPTAKLEHYRREWAKLPPPGEQKRMALRWRIRELMLQREIPHLRIISNDAIELQGRAKNNWKP